MAYRGEHEVREEEVRLRARWRWLRRTGVAGTANSVELLVRAVAKASAAAAAGAGGGERAKWRSEEERSAVGQMKARQEGAGQAGAAARRASPAHGGHVVCAT